MPLFQGLDPYQMIIEGTITTFSPPPPLGTGGGDANIIIFINESSYYTGKNVLINELNAFNNVATGDVRVAVVGVNCNPRALFGDELSAGFPTIKAGSGDVIEVNDYIPDYDFSKFYFVSSPRPPTMEILTTQVVSVAENPHGKFYIAVDSSGSMIRSDLEPTLSEFVAWIRSTAIGSHDDNTIVVNHSDERWMDWAKDAIQWM